MTMRHHGARLFHIVAPPDVTISGSSAATRAPRRRRARAAGIPKRRAGRGTADTADTIADARAARRRR